MPCPLHRHLFWTALTNYSSTGIYSQNVTSSSGPTHVPVRDLRQPGFLCMANHSKSVVHGWTWQSSELCRLQVLWYSSVLACMVVITDLSPCDLHSVMWYYVQCDKSNNLLQFTVCVCPFVCVCVRGACLCVCVCAHTRTCVCRPVWCTHNVCSSFQHPQCAQCPLVPDCRKGLQ